MTAHTSSAALDSVTVVPGGMFSMVYASTASCATWPCRSDMRIVAVGRAQRDEVLGAPGRADDDNVGTADEGAGNCHADLVRDDDEANRAAAVRRRRYSSRRYPIGQAAVPSRVEADAAACRGRHQRQAKCRLDPNAHDVPGERPPVGRWRRGRGALRYRGRRRPTCCCGAKACRRCTRGHRWCARHRTPRTARRRTELDPALHPHASTPVANSGNASKPFWCAPSARLPSPSSFACCPRGSLLSYVPSFAISRATIERGNMMSA